jgi:DNA invertase Pin-like site-specific DNA recombinase
MNPPAKAVPRAYSYLRFSTPEQAKGDSLRRQTALAEEYAQRHGLTLDTELNLRDLGVSAFRGDNLAVGALGAFLKAIGDELVPRGSVLLVEALDRVSRQSARKAVRILEDIVEAGITVVTLNDGKAYTEESLDGTDFLMAILLFMRGAEESATKAKRLKAVWSHKRERAARGEVQTVNAPSWLKAEGSGAKDARNAKLTLIPERAALVRRMFKMFLAGTGKKGVAQRFNTEKIPTWGGNRFHPTPAPYWRPTAIFKILTNPATTGRFVPHVERYEGGRRIREPQPAIENYFPRVIDDETYERVQSMCRVRRNTVRSGHVASIVAGLAKCPKCGSTMLRVMKGSTPKGGVPKLVCTKAKAGAGCTYHAVRLPELERGLIDNAVKLGNPPVADDNLAEQIRDADAALTALHEQIESLTDTIERRPSEALSRRLAQRESEAAQVKDSLQALRARAADAESRVVRHRATRLCELLTRLKSDPGAIAAANAALRECVDSIVVRYTTGELVLNWRHGVSSSLHFAWPTQPQARRRRA